MQSKTTTRTGDGWKEAKKKENDSKTSPKKTACGRARLSQERTTSRRRRRHRVACRRKENAVQRLLPSLKFSDHFSRCRRCCSLACLLALVESRALNMATASATAPFAAHTHTHTRAHLRVASAHAPLSLAPFDSTCRGRARLRLSSPLTNDDKRQRSRRRPRSLRRRSLARAIDRAFASRRHTSRARALRVAAIRVAPRSRNKGDVSIAFVQRVSRRRRHATSRQRASPIATRVNSAPALARSHSGRC